MGTGELKYMEYIKGRFPQYAISRVEYNMFDGKYCDIVIVNEEHVFKFARYDWSAAHVENEANAAGCIGSCISLPIPNMERLDRGIIKYNYIKGAPLYRNLLLASDQKARENIAAQLAIFLKQLHSVPLKKAESAGIAEHPWNLSEEGWNDLFEEIRTKVFPYCDSYTRECISQLLGQVSEREGFFDFQPALVHGDPAPWHIIADKTGSRINGIIDFGLSGIGDPAYDIGVVLDNLGEFFVKMMGRYYANIYSYMDRARFYAYLSGLLRAKSVSDMIATRDFSNFRHIVKERDIMPVGCKI